MRHNKLLEVALNKTNKQSDAIKAFLEKNKAAIEEYKEAKEDQKLGTIQEERAVNETATRYNFENVRRASMDDQTEDEATITTNLKIVKPPAGRDVNDSANETQY